MNKHIRITVSLFTFFVILISPFVFNPLISSKVMQKEFLVVLLIYFVIGLIVSVAAFALFSVWGDRRYVLKSGFCVFLLFYFLFFASAYGGQISYARFGLTVYRFIPIPYFDITVSRENFGLGFRKKTHLITEQEIEVVAGSDNDIVIVGNGWQSVAKVEKSTQGWPMNVIVLPTPDAIREFNKSVKEGKRVALILHSTC